MFNIQEKNYLNLILITVITWKKTTSVCDYLLKICEKLHQQKIYIPIKLFNISLLELQESLLETSVTAGSWLRNYNKIAHKVEANGLHTPILINLFSLYIICYCTFPVSIVSISNPDVPISLCNGN